MFGLNILVLWVFAIENLKIKYTFTHTHTHTPACAHTFVFRFIFNERHWSISGQKSNDENQRVQKIAIGAVLARYILLILFSYSSNKNMCSLSNRENEIMHSKLFAVITSIQRITIFCIGNFTLKFQKTTKTTTTTQRNNDVYNACCLKWIWLVEVDGVHFVIGILFSCCCCFCFVCVCASVCYFYFQLFPRSLTFFISLETQRFRCIFEQCCSSKWRRCTISKLFKLHHHHHHQQNFCHCQTIDMALIACGYLWHCLFVCPDTQSTQKVMIPNGDGVAAAADWQQ